MKNSTVLRTERNGVEYFTLAATGESGMSQTGLARACGITKQAMSKLEKALTTKSLSNTLKPPASQGFNPSTKSPSNTLKPSASQGFNPSTKKGFNPSGKAPSKWLQPFLGKDLNLSGDYEKNGGAVNVYTAEFCAAVIQHYAFKGNEMAQETLNATAEIGLTSYIQSVTGWLPEEFKAAPEAHKRLSEFLDLAREWDRGVMLVVDEEGYEVDMSDSWTFLDEVVFAGFTVEEYIKFEDENRLLNLSSHSKSDKIQLFFERNPEIAERLQPYTDKVKKLLGTGKNPHLFQKAFIEAYGSEPGEMYVNLIRAAIDTRIAQQEISVAN